MPSIELLSQDTEVFVYVSLADSTQTGKLTGKWLIEDLTATGELENTVIALVGDHNPYDVNSAFYNDICNDMIFYRYVELYHAVELLSSDLRSFLLIFLLQRLSVLLCKGWM